MTHVSIQRHLWDGQHSENVLRRQASALCALFASRSVACRRRALIRGRSHPIRFANGTWLAAHSAGSPLTALCAIVFSGGLVTMSLRESLERQDSHRMPKRNSFEQDLDKSAANYTPLSPLSL